MLASSVYPGQWIAENKVIEVWKDVPGYPLYKASSLGRVWVSERETEHKKGCNFRRVKKAMILNQYKSPSGYMRLSIQRKQQFAHRIIALAFLPNPNNYPFINHKNGIKSDNSVENLEWCTHEQNMKHASENGLIKGKKGEYSHFSKPVIELDIHGSPVREFCSAKEAADTLGVTHEVAFNILRGRFSELNRGAHGVNIIYKDKFLTTNTVVIKNSDYDQQELSFKVAEMLEDTFDIKHNGAHELTNAYEIESVIRSILDNLGLELIIADRDKFNKTLGDIFP